MWNTSLINILVLQKGITPIDVAKSENKQSCVHILETAMVCYFNIITDHYLVYFYVHYHLIKD